MFSREFKMSLPLRLFSPFPLADLCSPQAGFPTLQKSTLRTLSAAGPDAKALVVQAPRTGVRVLST